MNDERRDDQCIERVGFTHKSTFYSVAEYEDKMQWGKRIRTIKGRVFHEVVISRPNRAQRRLAKSTDSDWIRA